jgi:hypothetical protein
VVVISIRSVLSTPHLDSSTISKSNSIYFPDMVDVTTVTSVFATVLTGFPRRVLGFERLEEIMLAVTPGTVVLWPGLSRYVLGLRVAIDSVLSGTSRTVVLWPGAELAGM